MKCPHCELEFSDNVYPLHLDRCTEAPAKEEPKNEAQNEEPKETSEQSVEPEAPAKEEPKKKGGRK